MRGSRNGIDFERSDSRFKRAIHLLAYARERLIEDDRVPRAMLDGGYRATRDE